MERSGEETMYSDRERFLKRSIRAGNPPFAFDITKYQVEHPEQPSIFPEVYLAALTAEHMGLEVPWSRILAESRRIDFEGMERGPSGELQNGGLPLGVVIGQPPERPPYTRIQVEE